MMGAKTRDGLGNRRRRNSLSLDSYSLVAMCASRMDCVTLIPGKRDNSDCYPAVKRRKVRDSIHWTEHIPAETLNKSYAHIALTTFGNTTRPTPIRR